MSSALVPASQDNLALSIKEKSAALVETQKACATLETRLAHLERAREEDQSVLGQEIQRLTTEREHLSEALAEEAAKAREGAEMAALAAERLAGLEQACKDAERSRAEVVRLEALLQDATGELVSLQSDVSQREKNSGELQLQLEQSQAEVSTGAR